MLPPSQSWGTFPHHVDRSCWHWLCNQVIFFFPIGAVDSVIPVREQIETDWLLLFFVVLPQLGSQRCWSSSVCHNISKAWLFTHFGCTHEGGHAPCPLPSKWESSSSNIQTSKNHLDTFPESSPERNWHQTLLISAVAELRQDWTGMNYTHHLLYCENHLHNTTLPFTGHQTSS